MVRPSLPKATFKCRTNESTDLKPDMHGLAENAEQRVSQLFPDAVLSDYVSLKVTVFSILYHAGDGCFRRCIRYKADGSSHTDRIHKPLGTIS